MKCTQCQAEIKQGDVFCIQCGARVNWQQMPMQQAPMQQMYMQQMPMQQRQTQQIPVQQGLYQPAFYTPEMMTNNDGKKKKSKIKSILIAALSMMVIFTIIGAVVGIFSNGESSDKAEHTIMVYMIGSDLETEDKAASLDIQEMMNAKYGDDIKVVIQTGGAKKWWIEGIEDGKVQRFEVKTGEIIELANLGKVNMAKESTLADFIKFASEKYDADKYTLVLWDHGGGIPIGFGKDENFDNAGMTEAQIGMALKEADVEFETIVMDACYMCTLEVAMAVKDHAKYMVAAESYTAGSGMHYTSWFEYMEQNQEAIGAEYGELLVSNYMESVDDGNYIVSMSAINLSKIDKVYKAYVEYLESVLSKIEAGDYVNYFKARDNCGLYKDTDSVDMITLASKYKTDKSDALITAVVNAVEHTESDYIFGHGLAAYSPHEYINYYSDARESMEILKYDENALACYDAYASIYLAYLGNDYVAKYADDWYDETIVSQYVASGTQSGKYELATNIVDGYNVINGNNINWDAVSSIEAMMFMFLDDENLVMLGNDDYYEYDQYGNVLLDVPKKWIFINGYIAPYVCVSSYSDEASQKWMEIGTVFARCNGEEIVILIYFDNENPDGMIAGYMYMNFDTLSETSYGERIFSFKAGDDVEIIHPVVNGRTEELFYDNIIGQHFDGGSIAMKYLPIDLSAEKIACMYTLYDIYGNSYETEMFIFEE